MKYQNPAIKRMLKINIRKTRLKCEISLKLTIKTLKQ